jgi:hypothetical protein
VFNFGYGTQSFTVYCTDEESTAKVAFTLCSPFFDTGQYWTVYWRAYAGGTPVLGVNGHYSHSGGTQIGNGSFLIMDGVQIAPPQTIIFSRTVDSGTDVITVYVSDMSF